MNPSDAALALEAILMTENAALERHDPQGAIALISRKLAAAKALSAHDMTLEIGERLQVLAAENRLLLERAIEVQSQIITIVARAAQAVPAVSRYGAEGRAIPADNSMAITRQA